MEGISARFFYILRSKEEAPLRYLVFLALKTTLCGR
jgi:hypothetical protein